MEDNVKTILGISKKWNEEFDKGISKIEKKYNVKFNGWKEMGGSFTHNDSKVDFFIDFGDFDDSELSGNQIKVGEEWNNLGNKAFENYLDNMEKVGFEEVDTDEGWTDFKKDGKNYNVTNYAKKENEISVWREKRIEDVRKR